MALVASATISGLTLSTPTAEVMIFAVLLRGKLMAVAFFLDILIQARELFLETSDTQNPSEEIYRNRIFLKLSFRRRDDVFARGARVCCESYALP